MDTGLRNIITPDLMAKSMSYETYREMTDALLAENKTTGPNQSEDMVHYTSLNQQRMKRLDKTTKLYPETEEQLAKIKKPKIWLVLTEPWCGDAAQILPVLNKISTATANIDLHLLLRDEHPEVMDQFLTNGGRSIPKVIQLDKDTLEVEGDWGPRPKEVQEMILTRKKAKGTLDDEDYQELMIESQKWYLKDKTKSIQKEVFLGIGF